MKLTPKEEKITRLALDDAAQEGERAAAALKLIESLRARGVSVEDLQEDAPPPRSPPPSEATVKTAEAESNQRSETTDTPPVKSFEDRVADAADAVAKVKIEGLFNFMKTSLVERGNRRTPILKPDDELPEINWTLL